MTRIDLSDQIKEICSRLRVEYGLVAQITLRPGEAEVRQLKTNENGSKYLEPGEDGEMRVADETLTFEVHA